MAEVTIKIKDLPDGKVSVVCEPNFETMLKMEVSGETLTPAHGVAIFALNRVREQSKKDPNIGRKRTKSGLYI